MHAAKRKSVARNSPSVQGCARCSALVASRRISPGRCTRLLSDIGPHSTSAVTVGPSHNYSRCMTMAVLSLMIPLSGSSASLPNNPPVMSRCG